MLDILTKQLPTIRNIEEAERICLEFDAVVTAGPERFEVSSWQHPNHLVVSFDDVTSNRFEGAPILEQIRQIVEWGAKQEGSLLVHCHAGISRSTACAWGIAIAQGFDPQSSLEKLSEIHPYDQFWGYRPFRPNSLIITHLETIFGRRDLKTLIDQGF